MKKLSRQEREKLEKEKTIVTTARELFYSLGFYKTAMIAVSEKSEYTIRTLYRYFKNKNDLFFAVLYYDYIKLLKLIENEVKSEKVGYSKIEKTIRAFTEFSRMNKKFTTFTVRANQMIKNGAEIEDSLPFKGKYMKANIAVFSELIKMHEEAKRDGSIRSDLDAVQISIYSILMLTGYLDMYFACQDDYEMMYGLTENQMLNLGVNRLLESLKNS